MAAARFAKSPFNNARPKEAAREAWYTEIRAVACGGDCDDLAASATLLAFATGNASTLSFVPVANVGKQGGVTLGHLAGHGGAVTSLGFSPHDDSLLATGGEDSIVKVWQLGDGTAAVPEPSAALGGHERRVDALAWHPNASSLLASVSSDASVRIWDVASGAAALTCSGFADAPQALAWQPQGALLAVTCKDKTLRLFDPRAGSEAVSSCPSHEGVKGTRVLWVAGGETVLTTGFSKKREREVMLYSAAALTGHTHRTVVDSSTGVLLPFYDPDTNLLIMVGKGDTNTRLVAVENGALTDCSAISSREQTIGAAVLPKRALDVWTCEVARLVRLTSAGIVPTAFNVTRKSYVDFHSDLYPDTRGTTAGLDGAAWLAGGNETTPLVSMAPKTARPTGPAVSLIAPAAASAGPAAAAAGGGRAASSGSAAAGGAAPVVPRVAPGKWGGGAAAAAGSGEGASSGGGAAKGWSGPAAKPVAPAAAASSSSDAPEGMRRVQAPVVVRSSFFRHIACAGAKTEYCYTALRVNRNFAPESNGLAASSAFVAVPWEGTGGQLAVLPHGCGRVPASQPTVFHKSTFNDFGFSPYAPDLLATTSDDGRVQLWRIPAGGLREPMLEASLVLGGHTHRSTSLCFAPYVDNLLASASYDSTVRLWDLARGEACAVLAMGEGVEPVGLAFSYDSATLMTTSKDKQLRMHDPRANRLVASKEVHSGLKPARVVALGGALADYLLTVGFGERSAREVRLWDARRLTDPIVEKKIDTGSGVAMPFYDQQTGILMLAGRGDGSIKTYELSASELFEVAPYTSAVPQNAMCMLPKATCDPVACEFAKLFKLSGDTLEPLSFTVPRARKELFQDDVMVPCPGFAPAMDVAAWLSGAVATPPLQDVRPAGMPLLSEAAAENKRSSRQFVPKDFVREDTRDVKDKIVDSFESRMRVHKSDDVPQENMEGAAAEEWQE